MDEQEMRQQAEEQARDEVIASIMNSSNAEMQEASDVAAEAVQRPVSPSQQRRMHQAIREDGPVTASGRPMYVPSEEVAEMPSPEQPTNEEVIGEVEEVISLEHQPAVEEFEATPPFEEQMQETARQIHNMEAETGAKALPGDAVITVTDDELIKFNNPRYKAPAPVDTVAKIIVQAEPPEPNTKKHFRIELNEAAQKALKLHTGDVTGDAIAFSFVASQPYVIRVPQADESKFIRLFHVRTGGVFADKLLNTQLRLVVGGQPDQTLTFVLVQQEIPSQFPVIMRLVYEAPQV